jgi:6-pyruvoyltetrahydropterin/6-carboxytetrahydropterin synthase
LKATISKSHHFSASHVLPGLRSGHPCGRLHGHNYEVVLEVTGPVVHGWVLDYGDLKPFFAAVDALLDHRHLNDVLPEGLSPTAENLAAWLHVLARGSVPGLESADLHLRIGVSETPKTWAWYGG